MKLVSILVEDFPIGESVVSNEIEESIADKDPSDTFKDFISEFVGGRPDDRRVTVKVSDLDDGDRDRMISLEFLEEIIPDCLQGFIDEYVGVI